MVETGQKVKAIRKGIEAVRLCVETKWSSSVEATLIWIEVTMTGKEAVRTRKEAVRTGLEAVRSSVLATVEATYESNWI